MFLISIRLNIGVIKGILENVETLKSVPDCHKNREMCNEAVDNCSHALEFVLNNALWLKKHIIKMSILIIRQ